MRGGISATDGGCVIRELYQGHRQVGQEVGAAHIVRMVGKFRNVAGVLSGASVYCQNAVITTTEKQNSWYLRYICEDLLTTIYAFHVKKVQTSGDKSLPHAPLNLSNISAATLSDVLSLLPFPARSPNEGIYCIQVN
jgi:hypothetical protein